MTTDSKNPGARVPEPEPPLHSCLAKVLNPGESIVWMGAPDAAAYAGGGGARLGSRIGWVALVLAIAAFGASMLLNGMTLMLGDPLTMVAVALALLGLPLVLWPLFRRMEATHVLFVATAKRAFIVNGRPGSARVEVYSPSEFMRPIHQPMGEHLGSVHFFRRRPLRVMPAVGMGFTGVERSAQAFEALLSIYDHRPDLPARREKHVTLYVRGALIKARMSDR